MLALRLLRLEIAFTVGQIFPELNCAFRLLSAGNLLKKAQSKSIILNWSFLPII